MSGNRPMTLEEKRRRIMREQRVDWHAASRILAQRAAKVRHYRALARRAALGKPAAVEAYAGPRVVLSRSTEDMSPQDVSNISRQAAYLEAARAARGLGRP